MDEPDVNRVLNRKDGYCRVRGRLPQTDGLVSVVTVIGMFSFKLGEI